MASYFFLNFDFAKKTRPFMRGESKNALFLLSFIFCRKDGLIFMAKLESKFQKDLMDEIKKQYPGCVILKNDSGYIQGIPDWTILYKDKWAVLECKREKNSRKQSNQPYYVEKLNDMSFSRFVYPENKEEVLRDLRKAFES